MLCIIYKKQYEIQIKIIIALKIKRKHCLSRDANYLIVIVSSFYLQCIYFNQQNQIGDKN